MENNEPTITDVMGVVKDLAVSVQDLTEAVQNGFQKNDAAHASSFEIQRQTLELLNERTNVIDERLSKTQRRVEDIAQYNFPKDIVNCI